MSAAPKKTEWSVDEVRAQFKELPIGSQIPARLIDRLAEVSEMVRLAPDREIMRQGQINQDLYFLISGSVGVYVDGGRVSKLDQRGDMLGEMSVISRKEVGATLIAENAVTVLRVKIQDFMEVEGPDRDLAQATIYRFYAGVLAERLAATNEKAKHYELMNIKLHVAQTELERANEDLERKVDERTQKLEQQNTELMASKNKMEEVLHGRRVVFQKLNDFQKKNLFPLKAFLDDVRKRFPGEAVINDARDQVFEMQQVLTPLVAQYSTEQSVNGKHVLLADSQKKQQTIARLAMRGTGVNLDTASDPAEARRLMGERQYDLVVIDGTMVDLGNEVQAHNPRAGLVLMTSDAVPTYLPLLRQLNTTPQIVSRDEHDRTFSVKNILTTVTKVLSQDMFGLEKYLAWGCDIQRLPITGSRQRVDLLAATNTYFETIGVRRANRDRIHNVLEEMLMNAIFDAPTDENGHSLYNHIPRSQPVALKPSEQGLLRFATDGMLAAVSVQDPFGALEGSTLLRYLERNYMGQAAQAHGLENKAGAGRGLHQIVENSDLVVFNLHPKQKTEVIALFNVEVKDRAHLNSSFHLFIRD